MSSSDTTAFQIGGIQCRRCSGRMQFEKFYGPSIPFFGLRCLLCGDILDPVILLHRLSRNAQIPIPEGRNEILALIRNYLNGGAETEFLSRPPLRKGRNKSFRSWGDSKRW